MGLKEAFRMITAKENPESVQEETNDHVSVATVATEEIRNEDVVQERMRKIRERSTLLNDGVATPEVIATEQQSAEGDVFKNLSPNVRICEPKSYDNIKSISQAIKNRKIVILDMTKLEQNTATRISEFVFGMCSALDIVPEWVNPKTLMIDPSFKKKDM